MKVSIGPYPKGEDKERKIDVKIDKYDLWNLDHTLALVIIPALTAIKANKSGIPFVYYKDIPDHIAGPAAEDPESAPTKEGLHSRAGWDWILDEMIWAFQHTLDEWIDDPKTPETIRMKNGFRLFAEYYRALWT